jgi:hypothetical protein
MVHDVNTLILFEKKKLTATIIPDVTDFSFNLLTKHAFTKPKFKFILNNYTLFTHKFIYRNKLNNKTLLFKKHLSLQLTKYADSRNKKDI